MLRELHRFLSSALVCLGILSISPATSAAELTIEAGSEKKLTTQELLARPDIATIQVPEDVSYRRTMKYRAVPLRALLSVNEIPADTDLQITAMDGFVTNLPSGLLNATSTGAEPWLAIEPQDQPWPQTANGLSTGPFYLVWLNPAASSVMSEQWPFQVASIRLVPAFARRWPWLVLGNHVPTSSPVRRGQVLFATQCMVCHKMAGAGDATVGPDLNIPRNPTEYFQPWALKAFIRNPRSIRTWPDMRMPAFEEEVVSDPDLDAIIDYLKYMAERRQ